MAKQSRRAQRHPREKRVNLADACRHLAELVDGVVPAVVSSFASTDPSVRSMRLMEYGNELVIDASAFLTWLERNKHPGTADLEKRRLFLIADEAVACAASELPQFEGGKLREQLNEVRLTPDQERLGELVVLTMHEAVNLRNWAEEIDAEQSGQKHEVRAHGEKLFPKGVPDDSDLRDVIVKLANERSDENTDIGLVREFFGETAGADPKSRSMQGRIRALRQRGGTTLPTRD